MFDSFTETEKKYLQEAAKGPREFAERFLQYENGDLFVTNHPQEKIFASDKKFNWICIHRRAGKPLPDYAIVYTPKGPRKISEIKIGDKVCTPDGSFARVTSIDKPGLRPVYKITFSDFTVAYSASEHIWVAREIGKSAWKCVTLDYIKNSGCKNFEIPVINHVEFEKRKLPIDPYIFGSVIAEKKCPADLVPMLNKLGIGSDNSWKIPGVYLGSNYEDRLYLLNGYFDSSHEITLDDTERICTVVESNKTLLAGLVHLTRSLGCNVKINNNTLTILFPEHLNPFLISPKAISFNQKNPAELTKKIFHIEFVGVEPVRCINIDSQDHLFVTDNLVVTHNCVVGNTRVIDGATLRPIKIKDAHHIKEALVFDFKKNELVWSSCTWQQNGQKPCLKIECISGHNIQLSEDHLVLHKKRGWVEARTLKHGDQILGPASLPIFGNILPSDSNIETDVTETIINKHVSDHIFSYSPIGLKAYISKLWKELGRIIEERFIIFTQDINLAEDLSHLLLRFDIDSNIDEDNNIIIWGSLDKEFFLTVIADPNRLILDAKSPRRWEIVGNLKKIGYRDVYDLKVEHPDHNYIANDFVVHNSFSLVVIALFNALFHQNRKIAYFSPSQDQITEFFVELDKFIEQSAFVKYMQASEGNASSPRMIRTFKTRSTITGYPVGMAVNSTSQGKRGLTPDLIIVDEAQDIKDATWAALLPFMQGNEYNAKHLKNYIAGTIKKREGLFYKVFFEDYLSGSNQAKIYMPITENRYYIENPDILEERRRENPEYSWQTEWLLQPSSHSKSVFKQGDIENAQRAGNYEYGSNLVQSDEIRFLTVDWDKKQAGTSIAVVQWNQETDLMKVIHTEETPVSAFRYLDAVNRVLDLHYEFQTHLIIADQGQGEVQWELLMKEGPDRGMNMDGVLFKVPLGGSIEVPAYEGKSLSRKVLIKPYLVGLLEKRFQEGKIIFSAGDAKLERQLANYEVVKVTPKTIVYSSGEEHLVDCLSFSMYGWHMMTDNMYNPAIPDIKVPEKKILTTHQANINFWDQLKPIESIDDLDLSTWWESFGSERRLF